LSDFILSVLPFEDRVRRETALPGAKMESSNLIPRTADIARAELAQFGLSGELAGTEI
jgi:hypothetical protein